MSYDNEKYYQMDELYMDAIHDQFMDELDLNVNLFRIDEADFSNGLFGSSICPYECPPGLPEFLRTREWELTREESIFLERWLRNYWDLPYGWDVFVDHTRQRIDVDYCA